MIDLYDAEVATAGKIMASLTTQFARKSTSQRNLEELTMRATQEFFDAGLVVRVDVSPVLIGKPPEIIIDGRVPGSKRSSTEEGFELVDHDRKRVEVLKSKELGEKFHGQKERNKV